MKQTLLCGNRRLLLSLSCCEPDVQHSDVQNFVANSLFLDMLSGNGAPFHLKQSTGAKAFIHIFPSMEKTGRIFNMYMN